MGLLLALVVAAAPATAEPEVIRVSINPYLSYAPLFIAQREGFFAEQGLEVELVELRTTAMWLTPLIRGDLDVGAGPITPGILNAIARGAGVRIVAGKELYDPDGDCTFQGIVVSPELARAGEASAKILAGRRLSVDRDSIFGYFLDRLMTRDGLDSEAVTTEDLPAAAELEALRAGQIDAFNCGEPWLSRALDSGDAVLRFSAREALPGFQPGIVAFGPSLLEDRPDVGRRFLLGYLAGVAAYAEGKTDRNLDHLVGFQDLDRALLTRTCWPSIDRQGHLNVEELNRFQSWLVRRGLLDRQLATQEYFEPGFLPAAPIAGATP